MREQHTSPFVGLDIGTSAIRCVVGMPDHNDNSQLAIIGHGIVRNAGMRKGVITHLEDVASAIDQAIRKAEQVAGVSIDHATVNVNGAHVSGINSRGVVAISSANKEITESDRERVEEAATIIKLPPNREIIQIFAKNYRIDGQDNIKDPVGMQGIRLEVDTHIITALLSNLKNLDLVMQRANVRPKRYTVSSLGAAEAVLTRQQKEAGTLLLDIGAGTTNILVVEDDEIQHIGVLPIGSNLLTHDLAICLKTDLDIAEKVKIEHAKLGSKAKGGTVNVNINKKTHSFDAEEVTAISEARVDELFELVDKELKKIKRSQKLPGGVVIVGGMARLPGIAELARDKLQLAARIGKIHKLNGLIDSVADPSYATAVGLMMLDMMLPSSNSAHQGPSTTQNVFGALGGIWGKFKRN
ncbi:cell division protein FtsA [Candidatus Saccharibacteria bacterium]|nr:cell division protein FtsA [Candidatus Saccharibacteria bacterium]